jgi:hypothetical protein
MAELNRKKEWWSRSLWTFLVITLASIIHDEFSFYVCPAYWAPPNHEILVEGLPPFFAAILWGVIASVLFSIPGSMLLAWSGLDLDIKKYRRVLIWVCGSAVASAFLVWTLFYLFGTRGIQMLDANADVPDRADVVLFSTAAMHFYSYAAAIVMIIGLTIWWKAKPQEHETE